MTTADVLGTPVTESAHTPGAASSPLRGTWPGLGGTQRAAARCPRLTLPGLVTSRCFKIACRAVGVHPPLELSHYQIKFAATSLYDTSVAALYVINSHLSMNSMTHAVPRIGSGETCPVGPTSFEFLLPPDSPITISPSVGTVLPGKVGVGPTGGLVPHPGRLLPRDHSSGGGQLALVRPTEAQPEAGAPHAVPAGAWLGSDGFAFWRSAVLGPQSRWAQRPGHQEHGVSAWVGPVSPACPSPVEQKEPAHPPRASRPL